MAVPVVPVDSCFFFRDFRGDAEDMACTGYGTTVLVLVRCISARNTRYWVASHTDYIIIYMIKKESVTNPWWSSWLWHPAVMEYCYRVVGGSTPVSNPTTTESNLLNDVLTSLSAPREHSQPFVLSSPRKCTGLGSVYDDR